MSSKARRIIDRQAARPFDWSGANLPLSDTVIPPSARHATIDRSGTAGAFHADGAGRQLSPAAIEREAFTKGYAQGERAGFEAGGQRADAMLRRLTQTLDELASLRATIIRQTERQMIELAVAIARRIVRREVTLDGELMLALARVALDRLEARTPASIRLHPDDAVLVKSASDALGGHIAIVADASMTRGGCIIESEFGAVDAGVEAQLQEVSRALLGDDALAPQPLPNV